MQAGKLRHRLEFQEYQTIVDPDTGARSNQWVTLALIWGHVEPLSARDFIQASAMQSEVTARITIRYRPGITAAMRIKHRGRAYEIVGVLPDNKSGLEYITLPCKEGTT